MAFVTIPSASIEVGDPITKDIFDVIKADLDDHETRLLALGEGSGVVSLFNDVIWIGSTATKYLIGGIQFEVPADMILTEVSIWTYEHLPATTGSLTVDVKKNTTTNPTGFNTVLTTPPTILMSAFPYSKNVGAIDPSAQLLLKGDILKVDITSLPYGLQRFKLNILGEF